MRGQAGARERLPPQLTPDCHANPHAMPMPGEYISVASQRDAERADIEIERREQEKGPEARARELEELAQVRGCVRVCRVSCACPAP